MKNWRTKAVLALSALAVAVLVGAGWLFMRPAARADKAAKARGPGISDVLSTSRRPAERERQRQASRDGRRKKWQVKLDAGTRIKPDLGLSGEEEGKLSEFCRQVLKEVQDALDKEDLNALVIVIEKIRDTVADARAHGRDVNSVVPESVRICAVEACGWFGVKALPEIIDAIADASEEVRQMSVEQYQIALEDPKFGDYDRAELIKAAARAINDADALDTIFTSISDMRNSLIAETLIDILKNGTPSAQAVIREQIEIYTETDVATVSDIEKWLKANPDDPDDDYFYGPLEPDETGSQKNAPATPS
ncbi:MAG: hypothetical protein ACI4Q3_03710 [Kiritimatiellia bacterium]